MDVRRRPGCRHDVLVPTIVIPNAVIGSSAWHLEPDVLPGKIGGDGVPCLRGHDLRLVVPGSLGSTVRGRVLPPNVLSGLWYGDRCTRGRGDVGRRGRCRGQDDVEMVPSAVPVIDRSWRVLGAFSLATAQDTFWAGRRGRDPGPGRRPGDQGGPAPKKHERDAGVAAPAPAETTTKATKPEPRWPTPSRRLTVAPPRTRRPGVDPTGVVVRPPQVGFRPMDARPAPFPPPPSHATFKTPSRTWPTLPGVAAGQPRGSRHPPRPHARGHGPPPTTAARHVSAPLSIGELNGDSPGRALSQLHEGQVRPCGRVSRSVSPPDAHPSTWSPAGRDAAPGDAG